MHNKSNIVVYFAHLNFESSKINRALCQAISNIPNINFRDLHELYPDFFFDVAAEQAVLQDADLIVFQHPIYWYSVPAIFKHFLDTVFVRGFAYGPGGTALNGKDMLLAVSTGANELEYSSGGTHNYPFEELIRPIEQTARFCGMRFMQPMVLHGGHGLAEDVVAHHAARYRQLLVEYSPKSRKE